MSLYYTPWALRLMTYWSCNLSYSNFSTAVECSLGLGQNQGRWFIYVLPLICCVHGCLSSGFVKDSLFKASPTDPVESRWQELPPRSVIRAIICYRSFKILLLLSTGIQAILSLISVAFCWDSIFCNCTCLSRSHELQKVLGFFYLHLLTCNNKHIHIQLGLFSYVTQK